MKKIALLAFGLLLASPAYAADNTLLVTPCASGCITTKSKDIGAGVQAPQPVISDTGGNPLATPTAGADGASNTSTGLQIYARPSWWNGVTWDRAPGDVTNGAFVNVKTSVLPTGAATSAAQTTAQTSLSSIVTSTGASATAANQTSELTKLDSIISNTGAAIPAGSALIGKVGIDQTTPGTTNGVQITSQYPSAGVPLTISATGTTAATAATLAASAGGLKTYICGFSIRANATAAATANSTVGGTVTGTLNFTQWTAPLASGIGITEQIFAPCVPSSATNTAIVVTSAAPGSGGVVSVSAWGYQAP